jgi:hypothetical protein
MTRECGDCQLCCKLLPVASLHKKANVKCEFQKFHKGCTVYHGDKFPTECLYWNCCWILNDDTEEFKRPDRSHYVVDSTPSNFKIRNDDTGVITEHFAVQVWVDPNYPNAYKDPVLYAFLERRAKENNLAAMIRYNESDGIVLFAPCLNDKNIWAEKPFKSKEELRDPVNALTDKILQYEYERRNK